MSDYTYSYSSGDAALMWHWRCPDSFAGCRTDLLHFRKCRALYLGKTPRHPLSRSCLGSGSPGLGNGFSFRPICHASGAK